MKTSVLCEQAEEHLRRSEALESRGETLAAAVEIRLAARKFEQALALRNQESETRQR